MKKWMQVYTVLMLSGMLTASSVKGQINPSTAFYWENPYYINPASVNLDYMGFFSVAARKQWSGLDGAPATFSGTGALYWEDYHTQVGLKVINDRIGYVNNLDVSLSYAYVLRTTWNSFLNMGIAGSFQSKAFDRNKATVEDLNDPIFGNGGFEGRKMWNANAGLEYVYDKSFIVGIASQNLCSFFKGEESIFGGTNYLYGRYRTRILGRLYKPTTYLTTASPVTYDIEWGLCLKQYENDFQVDGVMSFYLNHNTQKEKFQFSLLGRSTGEFGILAGVKLISEMKILCSYDYNFKSLKGNTKGSFEVIVTYPLFPTKCISDGY